MPEWIDISMPLKPDMVIWPGQAPPTITFNNHFDDEHRSITSTLMTNVHNGTHVDAPLHFTPDGDTIERLPLEPYVGPATVIDVSQAEQVTADVLRACVPPGTERLLLRTRNSVRNASKTTFDTDFAGLDVSGARWVVDQGIKLVGNDYPSIALYEGDSEIHLALMRAGVGILEGLRLGRVEPGLYDLVALPVLIEGAEGAPVRAALRPR